jgi:hypothetical protein
LKFRCGIAPNIRETHPSKFYPELWRKVNEVRALSGRF